MEFSPPRLLAESFLPFVQAAWRRREDGARGVGSAAGASVVRRGGGGKPSSPINRSARGALEERQTPRIIMGHYSGDLDRKGHVPHEAGGCKRVLLLESVACGGLEDRLGQWRAALRGDPCNVGEQAVAERTARRFAPQGGRDAIGSKTEEEANS